MSLWFGVDVKRTQRGIVVVGENIEGNRSVEVLLPKDVLDKLKEMIENGE